MENKVISKGCSKCVVTYTSPEPCANEYVHPAGTSLISAENDNISNFLLIKVGWLIFLLKMHKHHIHLSTYSKNHYIDYVERYVCWDNYLNSL